MAESGPTFSISTNTPLVIGGAGPAGSSAAIAARACGAEVVLTERGLFPRHKVCGEFLSPEITPLLEHLGVLSALQASRPATIRRMLVRVGSREKSARLPEPALGLSRYRFDHLLLQQALQSGATLSRQGPPPTIEAWGRASRAPRGRRLFGFKAHFQGPADDAVELYFDGHCYIGINCVEDGITNVCGLAPEDSLRRVQFHVDELLKQQPALSSRLRPLTRTMNWLFTGPLEFGHTLANQSQTFRAGDALSFVDPFTGTGLLSAIATGALAGKAAARGEEISSYHASTRKLLAQPFSISSILRSLASTVWAERLLPAVPGQLLFWATRPRVGKISL